MAQINFTTRTVRFKIAFCGADMSGKTSTVKALADDLLKDAGSAGGSLSTTSTAAGDAALSLEVREHSFGDVMGLKACFEFCTVPAHAMYSATRRLLLADTDGIVFVADSSPARLQDNVDALNTIAKELGQRGRRLADVPIVFQYNKRDLADAVAIGQLNERLNPAGAPVVGTAASEARGIMEVARRVTALAIERFVAENAADIGAPAPEQAAPSPAEVPAVAQPSVTPPSGTQPAPAGNGSSPEAEQVPATGAEPTAPGGAAPASAPAPSVSAPEPEPSVSPPAGLGSSHAPLSIAPSVTPPPADSPAAVRSPFMPRAPQAPPGKAPADSQGMSWKVFAVIAAALVALIMALLLLGRG